MNKITDSEILKLAISKICQVEAAGDRIQRSSPVQKVLEDLGLDVAKHLADSYFEWPGPKPIDIFDLGCDIGRLAKQKIVTWAVLEGKHYLYFIGTEAETLRKLEMEVAKTSGT